MFRSIEVRDATCAECNTRHADVSGAYRRCLDCGLSWGDHNDHHCPSGVYRCTLLERLRPGVCTCALPRVGYKVPRCAVRFGETFLWPEGTPRNSCNTGAFVYQAGGAYIQRDLDFPNRPRGVWLFSDSRSGADTGDPEIPVLLIPGPYQYRTSTTPTWNNTCLCGARTLVLFSSVEHDGPCKLKQP